MRHSEPASAAPTFIEETPSLFQLPAQPGTRATKIIEFLGDRIVNTTGGDKPFYENREIPQFDEKKSVYGARDESLKLGARDFTQKILNDKKLYVTDTTMRDAQQSLMATRMPYEGSQPVQPVQPMQLMQNAYSVECWGGATFDTAYRLLKESPWKRLEILRERMPNTMLQMLLRASNAVGYSNYPGAMWLRTLLMFPPKPASIFSDNLSTP